MKQSEIQLTKLPKPMIFTDVPPTFLTDETMNERKQKVLENMKSENYDTLVIYADKEHGGNFEYLTGFIPRFEEGLLVLDVTGESTLILGNENLKMAKVARIENQLIHSPLFLCQTSRWIMKQGWKVFLKRSAYLKNGKSALSVGKCLLRLNQTMKHILTCLISLFKHF